MDSNTRTTLALAGEFLPGLFGLFGLGHVINGNILKGLLVFLAFWALQAVNAALMLVLVGFVTAPLTWLAFLILSPANIAATAQDRKLLTVSG